MMIKALSAAPLRVYTPVAHLPSFCHKLDAYHSHSGLISQTCCLQCVTGLQHPPLAQRTLPGPSETSQACEAILWGPTNVCCYLQQHRVGGDTRRVNLVWAFWACCVQHSLLVLCWLCG